MTRTPRNGPWKAVAVVVNENVNNTIAAALPEGKFRVSARRQVGL